MVQLNLAIRALLEGIKALRHPALVVPIFCLTALQLLALGLVLNFDREPWVEVMAPYLTFLHGDAAIHYPGLLVLLPNIMGVNSVLLAGTLGIYLWGVAILLLARHFQRPVAGSWGVAGRAYWSLFLAQLPVVILALLVFYGPAWILGDTQVKGNALRALNYGSLAFGVIVESLFLFAPMAVLLESRNPFSAIARSASLWQSNLLTALLIVGVPTLLHFPFAFVLRRSATIATKFSPETVALIVATEMLFFLVTNFVLVSAGTMVFLVRRQEA